MARIAGINIPPHKHAEIGLTSIYGIGRSTAQKICAELGLDPDTKVSALTDDEVSRIRAYVDEHLNILIRPISEDSRTTSRGRSGR